MQALPEALLYLLQ
jgi:hypothetical protein